MSEKDRGQWLVDGDEMPMGKATPARPEPANHVPRSPEAQARLAATLERIRALHHAPVLPPAVAAIEPVQDQAPPSEA